MIEFNTAEVLKKAAEESRQDRPLPKIELSKASDTVKSNVAHIASNAVNQAVIAKANNQGKSDLVQSLWIEFNAVKNQRNDLSTKIAHMVENGATQDELRDHYERIESLRPALQDLYDKIEYAEKHGELPRVTETRQDPETIADLKLKKQRLVDERSKLKRKLELKAGKNPDKYVEWELRLAQAGIEMQDIIDRIKTLEGKG